MDDLLQSQIKDSCNLALPEGLKDLMSDISREVLRAQPNDLLGFIRDYLSCLLVTRENLHVACQVYDSVCLNRCRESLREELKQLGICKDDIETIQMVVEKHFTRASVDKPVNEPMLMSKLLHKTSIVMEQIPDIQEAIRKSFLRFQVDTLEVVDFDVLSLKCVEEDEDVLRAIYHTLKLYKDSKPTENQLHQAATKIQTAYRAYGVRRNKIQKERFEWSYLPADISNSSIEDKFPDEYKRNHSGESEEEDIFRERQFSDVDSSILETGNESVNLDVPEEIAELCKQCDVNEREEEIIEEIVVDDDDTEEDEDSDDNSGYKVKERDVPINNEDSEMFHRSADCKIKHNVSHETMNVEYDHISEVSDETDF